MSTKNKVTFVNKYENYSEKKGKVFKEPSVTDKTKAVDCDIYACIEKYGIGTLTRKTQATEYLYGDMTNVPKTLDEAIRQREKLDNYFKAQPARVRKQFGDSPEEFYQKFKAGEFNDFIQTGVLNEEIAARYLEEINKNEQPTTLAQETTNSENIPSDTNQGNN